MSLAAPESVPLRAGSDASFSDDGLRSEPSFGSLQELEFVDRWPSEAPPPPDVLATAGELSPRLLPLALIFSGGSDTALKSKPNIPDPSSPRGT